MFQSISFKTMTIIYNLVSICITYNTLMALEELIKSPTTIHILTIKLHQ